MNLALKRILSAFILSLAVTLSAHAYNIPEQLDYQLTWEGIKVGTSSIRTAFNGSDLEIVSKVNGPSWSAPFYKVDDLETTKLRRAEKGGAYTFHNYKLNLLEGPNRVYRAVSVDRKAKKFRYVDLLGFGKWTQNLVEPVWDPVSSLYYVRQQPLAVGKSIYVSVVDKSGVKKVRVSVLRKETVKTPAGSFRTIVVSPDMTVDSEGLFYARGRLTIWLTDDERKVPVIIEKKIDDLFRNGVPPFLQTFVPPSMKAKIPKMETIRAVLVSVSQ